MKGGGRDINDTTLKFLVGRMAQVNAWYARQSGMYVPLHSVLDVRAHLWLEFP